MSRPWTLAAFALVLPVAGAAAAPLKVFVTTPAPSTPVTGLEQKRSAAAKSLEEEEKRFEKQYGGNRKKWPAEAVITLAQDVERAEQARIAVYTSRTSAKDLEDSKGDLKNSFVGKGLARKKKNVELVESTEEADLVIEPVGRSGGSKLTIAPKYLAFRITAGGHLDPETLGAVKRAWKSGEQCWLWHPYTSAEPYLLLEATHTERWRDVMDVAAACVNDLVGEHEAPLAAGHR